MSITQTPNNNGSPSPPQSKSPSPDPSEPSNTTTSSIFKGNVWGNQITFRQWKEQIAIHLDTMTHEPECCKVDYVLSQLDGQALEFLEYALKFGGGGTISARRMVNRLTEKYDPEICTVDIRFG